MATDRLARSSRGLAHGDKHVDEGPGARQRPGANRRSARPSADLISPCRSRCAFPDDSVPVASRPCAGSSKSWLVKAVMGQRWGGWRRAGGDTTSGPATRTRHGRGSGTSVSYAIRIDLDSRDSSGRDA